MPRTKDCPHCHATLAASRRTCPDCGHAFSDGHPPTRPVSKPSKPPHTATPNTPSLLAIVVTLLIGSAIMYGVFLLANHRHQTAYHAEQAALAAARAAHAAEAATPTPRPTPTPKTGLDAYEVRGYVKIYLHDTAYVPESLKYHEWGDVTEDSDGTYWLPCRWSGKNRAGVEIQSRHLFHVSASGQVIDVLDWE